MFPSSGLLASRDLVSRNEACHHVRPPQYDPDMTVSAADVAADLRREVWLVPTMKLHRLLYYCQGHYLAHLGEPLFSEAISAWDDGPVVDALWHAESEGVAPSPSRKLTNGELNTIGYVASRYGGMNGLDLKHLTQAEDPWRMADRERVRGGSAVIEHDWMRDYFRAAADYHEPGEVWFSREQIAELTAGAAERHANFGPVGPDETPVLQARLAALLRARTSAA
jgi:uncharacterized phage-associated protein